MDNLRLFAVLLLLTAQAAIAPQLQAQGGLPLPPASAYEVVGFSYIYPPDGPGGATITAYAVTEMGSEVAPWYDASVDAYLRQGNNQVASGNAGPISPTAEGLLQATSAAAIFHLNSYHYLDPFPTVDEEENYVYADPLGFASLAGGGYGQGSFAVEAPLQVLDPYGYTNAFQIYLGSTWWDEYGTAPQINGISPNTVAPNSSGTLSIAGLYLTAADADHYPTVNVTSGSGLNLGDVHVIDDDALDVDYTTDSNVSTGAHGITVTNTAGTSNEYNVSVVDPVPAITSASPNPWEAADSPITVTITGTGFGTNPQLSITGSVVVSATLLNQSQDLNTITASVTLNGSAGTARVAITSLGYGGQGFFQGGGTSAGSNAMDVPVNAVPAPPAPTIVLGVDSDGSLCSSGANVAESTQDVFVGQQIAFTVCTPGGQAATQGWSFTAPGGGGGLANYAVGGFDPTAARNQVQAVSYAYCSSSDSFCYYPAFYFVTPTPQGQTYQFTYTYTPVGWGSAVSATIQYRVTGPTPTGPNGAYMTAAVQEPPPTYDGVHQTTPAQIVNVWPGQQPYLGFGQNSGKPGIVFYAAAQAPQNNAGSFQFVQVITQSDYEHLSNAVATGTLGTGLDNWYPYPVGVYADGTVAQPPRAGDHPGLNLSLSNGAPVGESSFMFGATMYLLWDPALPVGCSAASNVPLNGQPNQQPSHCSQSIPVPLGYVTWGFVGGTINTLDPNAAATPGASASANGTGWVLLPCTLSSQATFQQNSAYQVSSYPTWALTAHNN